ncbi:hypothetical protein [Caldalkalibacillus mannanilyticus]|uniref:hypothetical protein n=1 Tax=Caldalkalibacillus mannanilyticus TaxID=1418 RepID=UPI0004695A02|nr:hypothetical protein [Caldalkalibacillus mannanilyticus]
MNIGKKIVLFGIVVTLILLLLVNVVQDHDSKKAENSEWKVEDNELKVKNSERTSVSDDSENFFSVLSDQTGSFNGEGETSFYFQKNPEEDGFHLFIKNTGPKSFKVTLFKPNYEILMSETIEPGNSLIFETEKDDYIDNGRYSVKYLNSDGSVGSFEIKVRSSKM